MIRVALVDDQPLVRAGLRTMLGCEDDLEIVGEAADGHQALALIRATRPDVVLMDVRMPGLDGIAALREITADPGLSAVRVLILTTFDLDEHVEDALRAGASGFVLKDIDPDELVRSIRVVAAGEAWVAPSVLKRMVRSFVSRPTAAAACPEVSTLTAREREVVALVARGLSNDEIAVALTMSSATARTHVSRAMTKLRARDRAQLVVIAYQCGLADRDS